MSFTTYEGETGTHRALKSDGTLTRVQGHTMHKGYMTVEPEPIAQRLEASGKWDTRIFTKIMRSGDHKTHAWSKILEVRDRAELAPGYRAVFKVLFNHQGKHALKIVPGAVRCVCENEFMGEPCWRATHLDTSRITDLQYCPNQLFNELALEADKPFERVESLRGVPVHMDWKAVFERAMPRLGVWTHRAWQEKYRSNVDMWGMLQSLTEIKRPGGQKVAAMCLTDAGWEQTKKGKVPEALINMLVTADVASQLN